MTPETKPADPDLVLAEDDPDDRFLILHALRRLRPQLAVKTVMDGLELLAHLRGRAADQPPKLVLLDLNMPRMDGRDVLKAMAADAALNRIPVIVMTTSVEPEDRERARNLGATAYISKPEGFGTTVSVLREMLDARLGPLPTQEI